MNLALDHEKPRVCVKLLASAPFHSPSHQHLPLHQLSRTILLCPTPAHVDIIIISRERVLYRVPRKNETLCATQRVSLIYSHAGARLSTHSLEARRARGLLALAAEREQNLLHAREVRAAGNARPDGLGLWV